VVVLTGQRSNPLYIDAATNAALDLGAKVFRLDLPPVRRAGRGVGSDPNAYLGATALTGNRAAVEAMKQADMVIDLMFLLFSPEQTEILRSGTRILLVVEPPDILARILPSPDDRRRVKAAEARLKRAGTMRIASEAGTDLRVELGQYPVLTEYGFADEPGRWDHWPSGFVATWPNEGSATGTVVLDRGDIIFPFKTYVKTPIKLAIREGYIRAIEGDFDADYLREYMAMFQDPEGYAISHLGWGLQPKAQWAALEMYDKSQTLGMDGRAFYGNFLFSTGPNTEAGGTRSTPCHVDIPMRNCSLFLDGEPMVAKGDVIPEDQRVEGVKVGAA
jgi:2,5-dihydroxypyridine 5,6-dioxygenase